LSDSAQRQFDVYKLRNAAAADVATAVQTFMTSALAVYTGAQFASAYAQLQRNVVIQAEPVSNTLLVSATPQYFAELKRIIERIDAQPPQVVIQVLIAEVQLTNNEEMGVEFGVQSPVLFNRGGSLNFNTTSALPSSNVSPAVTAFQGLGNLGVGRASTLGPGGLVFSAQSNSFNLLVRALKAQGRIDILSRPHLHVADNQTGYINVGQNYPTPTGSTLTATGAAQTGVQYVPVGIILRVTPRINPDGKVLMRVEPQVSNVAPSTVNVGNGINAPIFNQETVETTVLAADGETIVIGGLINKQDNRQETGIPFFKDIPYVGSLFRYRTMATSRREVLFIMTPHIIRSEYDTARILAEESRKMNWCLPDIAATHTYGMEVMGPAAKGAMPIPVGGTPPGQIPPGMLPSGFGPGFVPAPILPGPGGDFSPDYVVPPAAGSAAPVLPSPNAMPNAAPRPGQPLPAIPPAAGIPILNSNGTLSPVSAVVYPGSTQYVLPAGGPAMIAVPQNPAVAGPPVRNSGVIMAYPPAQDAPAQSKVPAGKEARPWSVISK
jgi:Flp pilus assembly secretin CpaC